MGWTIFTAIDLYVGVVMLDLMATSVAPEKLPRLRVARRMLLIMLAISISVLIAQFARSHQWIPR
ncbi:MAG TPA: hypothetical protein VGS27_33500 [Candidatus Sulfotelmatobacter sp.]|nr:hypothetical protein [Candidatus Sulfotelmatobacter sp.]